MNLLNGINILNFSDSESDLKVLNHLKEICSRPQLIKVRADGSLDIDDVSNLSLFIDDLAEKLPIPPNLKDVKSEDKRKEIKCIYQVEAIRSIFPYTESVIESLKDDPDMNYFKIRQKLSELGKDIELIVSACNRRFTISQVLSDQWKSYGLTFAEVLELEQVAAARREISVKRANWESSEVYPTLNKVDILKQNMIFDEALEKVTSPLWKVLHLGANYLTGRERSKILLMTKGMSRKERHTETDSILVKLRIAHLEEYRRDKINYKLPTIKS